MNRIKSIDTIRLLAIIAVISIHTTPFRTSDTNTTSSYIDILINQGARFAVPFFFIISGFFFAKKIISGCSLLTTTTSVLKRLGIIWLFFSIVYILPYDLYAAFNLGLLGPLKVIYWNLARIANEPLTFIFEGTKVHLWFLVSLAISVIITSVFIYIWKSKSLLPLVIFSIALYVIGLLSKAYSETPFGIDINFNTRNGPFFSTIFFVIGYMLSYLNITPKYLLYGLLILILGYTIHFLEIYYLYTNYQVSPTSHDYVAGTLLVGIGVSLMALSNHSLLSIQRLSNLGKYTLGIYAIHFVFVDLLLHFDKQLSSSIWEIGYIFLVLFFSIITTLALARHEKLKKLFM